MCTMISESLPITGRVKSGGLWTSVSDLSVAYDHPTELDEEHAFAISITGPDLALPGRVALELGLEDARRLLETLHRVMQAADAYEHRAREAADQEVLHGHGSPPAG